MNQPEPEQLPPSSYYTPENYANYVSSRAATLESFTDPEIKTPLMLGEKLAEIHERTGSGEQPPSVEQMSAAMGLNLNLSGSKLKKLALQETIRRNHSLADYAVKNIGKLSYAQKSMLAFELLGIINPPRLLQLSRQKGINTIDPKRDNDAQFAAKIIFADMGVDTKINLCKAIHLYEMQDLFAEDMRHGQIDRSFRDFYRQWSKGPAGRTFISEAEKLKAADKNVQATSPTTEMGMVDESQTKQIPESLAVSPSLHPDNKRVHEVMQAIRDCDESRSSGRSFETYSRDIIALYKKFVIASHEVFGNINPSTRKDIADSLEYMFTPLISHPDDNTMMVIDEKYTKTQRAVVNELQQDVLRKVSHIDFFRAIHLYGISEEFESSLQGDIIPVSVKSAYLAWKKNKVSQKFIAKCEAYRRLEALGQGLKDGEKELWELRQNAPNENSKKLYELMLINMWAEDLQATPMNLRDSVKDIIREINLPREDWTLHLTLGNFIALHIKNTPESMDAFGQKELSYLQGFANAYFQRNSDRSDAIRFISERIGVEPLFRFIHFAGAEQAFLEAIDRQDIPYSTVEEYQTWSASPDNQGYIKRCHANLERFGLIQEPQGAEVLDAQAVSFLDPTAVPEEIKLFQQAQSIQGQIEPLTSALTQLGQGLEGQISAIAEPDLGNIPFDELRELLIKNMGAQDNARYLMAYITRGEHEAPKEIQRQLYKLINRTTEKAREGESPKADRKRFIRDHAAFIDFILKYKPSDFDACDILAIAGNLAVHFKAGPTLLPPQHKALLETLSQGIAPYSLYRAVHIYGVDGNFAEALEKGRVARKFRFSYHDWAKKNGDFIRDTRFNSNLADAQIYMEKSWLAADSAEIKKFYMLCHCLLRAAEEKDIVQFDENILTKDEVSHFFSSPIVNITKLLLKHRALLDADEESRNHFFVHIHSVLTLSALDSDLDMHPLNVLPRDEFFSFVLMAEQEDKFRKLLDTGKFPHVTYDMYEAWKADPDAFKVQSPAEREIENGVEPIFATLDAPLEIVSSLQQEEQNQRLTYIDVDHPLVTYGNRKDSMGYAPMPEDSDLETGGRKDEFQDRTEILTKALLADPESGVRHITVWRDKRNMDKETGRPYNLLDIRMNDGSLSRVAVCDWYGHMTYVHRDAPEISHNDILQISVLRADPKVWTAVHVTDKQWTERIQTVILAPVSDLTPELKSRSYWHGLRGVLTETFIATVASTGNLPSGRDKSPFELGPLAGRTTPLRAYHAAYSGSIEGYDKGTTFKKIFDQLVAGNYPELAQFLGGRKKLHARDIASACRSFARSWNFPVQDGFYDELKVDGRDGHAINLALRFGAVAGLSEMIPQEEALPTNLVEFQRILGIGDDPACLQAA